MSSEPAFAGGCQCGQVTYSSTHLPSNFTCCHCSTCRKVSGAPFLTFGQVPVNSLTFTPGLSSLKKTAYSDFADRTHCAECGSPISMQYKWEPEVIHLTAGTINEQSVKGNMPKIGQHLFVQEKAGWFSLPDDEVPKCQTFGSGFQKKLEAWKKS
ncbi:putative lyase [Lachnellula arida]|uniref:Putative lyase n=1 Tax=Lachnellula arida TaxID=1316785 RepID=A0A8T9BG18_9HELO|nr:putative lyase [Lachnellula arida]